MNRPWVSVLTPVYNGERYLAECIESVLAQEYTAFEYTIVNNCSKDASAEIASAYAGRDSRVRVVNCDNFVSAIDNHNRAFRMISDHSKYCKVVSADDQIAPGCIGKMVALAEAHPSVGMVGCYQRSGATVKWQGLPDKSGVVAGRDAARLALLERVHFFGTPTSVLYRSDLIRKRDAFFPHERSHADTSACYEVLQHSDLGFLHEVLCAERVHSGQWSAKMEALDSGIVAYLEIVLQYGPIYLSEEEFSRRKKEVADSYYRHLGSSVWKLKGQQYWKFHQSRMNELGCEFEWARVVAGALQEAGAEARNPAVAMRKMLAVIKSA